MSHKFVFPLFCFLVSLLIGVDSQGVQARAPTPHQVGRAAWEVAPLPPPTPTADGKVDVTTNLDAPIAVRIGQWATIRNTPETLGVQLSGLVSDNRCPAQVDCAVAGQVQFILIVRLGDVIHQERFQIGTYTANDQNQVRFAGYTIEITDVEPPAPPPGQHLPPRAYVATLVVHVDDMATATPAPTGRPTATPIAQDDQEQSQAVAFDQPFLLRVGETASIRDANFRLTLRSLSDDSGCVSARDCSLMLADGTLVLAQGDEQEVLTFSTSFTADQSFDYEFANYMIQLTHVEQARNGEQVATFVIQNALATVEIPTPERAERCPAFSRFDAAAILQEDVEQQAVTNLVFGPIATDLQEIRGLCGYVNTGFTTDQVRDEQTAYLATELAADHAVAAMLLADEDVMQLVQLAELIRAANPDADPDALLLFQSQVAAGDYTRVIGYLADTAFQLPGFTVEPIQGIGDEGVWIWQALDRGHLAMFISRYGDTFSVVVALLGDEVDELTVLDYAVIIARRLGEEPLAQIPTEPTADTPGNEPGTQPGTGCDLLSIDEATAILGERVHAPVIVDDQEGLCLYVPSNEPLLSAEQASLRGPEHAIITYVVAPEDVADHVTSTERPK